MKPSALPLLRNQGQMVRSGLWSFNDQANSDPPNGNTMVEERRPVILWFLPQFHPISIYGNQPNSAPSCYTCKCMCNSCDPSSNQWFSPFAGSTDRNDVINVFIMVSIHNIINEFAQFWVLNTPSMLPLWLPPLRQGQFSAMMHMPAI